MRRAPAMPWYGLYVLYTGKTVTKFVDVGREQRKEARVAVSMLLPKLDVCDSEELLLLLLHCERAVQQHVLASFGDVGFPDAAGFSWPSENYNYAQGNMANGRSNVRTLRAHATGRWRSDGTTKRTDRTFGHRNPPCLAEWPREDLAARAAAPAAGAPPRCRADKRD
jgi:hypothetical protein